MQKKKKKNTVKTLIYFMYQKCSNLVHLVNVIKKLLFFFPAVVNLLCGYISNTRRLINCCFMYLNRHSFWIVSIFSWSFFCLHSKQTLISWLCIHIHINMAGKDCDSRGSSYGWKNSFSLMIWLFQFFVCFPSNTFQKHILV